MPHLAYETDGTLRAGRLTGRALIGRRLSHGVVLDDPSVSRLHAWIDRVPEGGWMVADAGSKNGIAVNGKRTERQALVDGDVIRVGATQLTFRTTDDLPTAAEPVSLTPPAGESVRTSGILFDCEKCASPIWVGVELVGKRGRCRHCKKQVVVPIPSLARAAAKAASAPTGGRRPQCGVCHAAIGNGEDLKACPECDTTFHAECWAENYGCSTYGCGQVDALNPNPTIVKPAAVVAPVEPKDADHVNPAHDEDDEAPPTEWEWLTVLGTLLAAVLGMISFGIPALAMAIVAGIMLGRRGPLTRTGILALALVIALLGIPLGLAGSDYFWLAGRHLPFMK